MVVALMGSGVTAIAGTKPCEIEVVEKGAGWPVPLVELRMKNGVTFVTDNAGLVAFDLPELMGKEVWFGVRGQGYEVPKDRFGLAGVHFKMEPGTRNRIEVTRTIIARRLGRLTGAGLFGESQKLGRETDWKEGGVLGCDTIQNAVYGGRMYWFWGDTQIPWYGLEIFDGTGATTSTKPVAMFEPPLRVQYDYVKDDNGAPRGVAKMPSSGPTWLAGCVNLPDASGKEHLAASYGKVHGWLDIYQWGLCVWNDATKSFEHLRVVWEQTSAGGKQPLVLNGHAVKWTDTAGKKWVLFCNPFPFARCPATFEAWQDTNSWESLRMQKTLRAADSKEKVDVHGGAIAWNPWRKRWVTIFVQAKGTSSNLGEIWYAEADAPTGPWGPAVKVLSHDNYSFYNPAVHPEFTPENSPVLLFEGTYTAEFANRPQITPKYNYNQILYRLDLDDPRLLPARGK